MSPVHKEIMKFKLQFPKAELPIHSYQGKHSLLSWQWGTGTTCPEKQWMSHPCRYSRSGWMGCWADRSSAWLLCPRQGVEAQRPLRSFPTQVIPWLYDFSSQLQIFPILLLVKQSVFYFPYVSEIKKEQLRLCGENTFVWAHSKEKCNKILYLDSIINSWV